MHCFAEPGKLMMKVVVHGFSLLHLQHVQSSSSSFQRFNSIKYKADQLQSDVQSHCLLTHIPLSTASSTVLPLQQRPFDH